MAIIFGLGKFVWRHLNHQCNPKVQTIPQKWQWDNERVKLNLVFCFVLLFGVNILDYRTFTLVLGTTTEGVSVCAQHVFHRVKSLSLQLPMTSPLRLGFTANSGLDVHISSGAIDPLFIVCKYSIYGCLFQSSSKVNLKNNFDQRQR